MTLDPTKILTDCLYFEKADTDRNLERLVSMTESMMLKYSSTYFQFKFKTLSENVFYFSKMAKEIDDVMIFRLSQFENDPFLIKLQKDAHAIWIDLELKQGLAEKAITIFESHFYNAEIKPMNKAGENKLSYSQEVIACMQDEIVEIESNYERIKTLSLKIPFSLFSTFYDRKFIQMNNDLTFLERWLLQSENYLHKYVTKHPKDKIAYENYKIIVDLRSAIINFKKCFMVFSQAFRLAKDSE